MSRTHWSRSASLSHYLSRMLFRLLYFLLNFVLPVQAPLQSPATPATQSSLPPINASVVIKLLGPAGSHLFLDVGSPWLHLLPLHAPSLLDLSPWLLPPSMLAVTVRHPASLDSLGTSAPPGLGIRRRLGAVCCSLSPWHPDPWPSTPPALASSSLPQAPPLPSVTPVRPQPSRSLSSSWGVAADHWSPFTVSAPRLRGGLPPPRHHRLWSSPVTTSPWLLPPRLSGAQSQLWPESAIIFLC